MRAVARHRVGEQRRRSHVDVFVARSQSWDHMYAVHPTEEINLEQLETFAFDRWSRSSEFQINSPLVVLRNIELWRLRNIPRDTLVKNIEAESLSRFGPRSELSSSRKDIVSHHVLRIAYCKTEALREWFVQQETLLFQIRLSGCTGGVLERLADANQIKVRPLEFGNYPKDDLRDLFRRLYPTGHPANSSYYEVPYTCVLDLVRRRKVVIRNGVAFVTAKQLGAYLLQEFEKRLKLELIRMQRRYEDFSIEESDRLAPFFDRLTSDDISDLEDSAFATQDNVTPEMVPRLAEESFPLCMKVMHHRLTKFHKLKHLGRMEFGLFLKGIGLDLGNAIRFWKMHFCRIMTDSDFQKNYLYNIKHNYGAVGKRMSYSPYGCRKIITEVGEDGGCPFRTFAELRLRQLLQTEAGSSLSQQQLGELVHMGRKKQFMIACRRFFDCVHPAFEEWPDGIKHRDTGMPFFHPNVYYRNSREIRTGGKVVAQTGTDSKIGAGLDFSASATSSGETSGNADDSAMDIDG